ncbi:MAG: tetratricopeptide repeat protein [Chloroflexi bacterium]|nr:tetratricopeptide repeat protein [Chloroflexota bacterium]
MAQLTENYRILFKTIGEIAETYHRQGDLDAAKKILQLGKDFSDSSDLALSDKTEFLLLYAKIRLNTTGSVRNLWKQSDVLMGILNQVRQYAETAPNEGLLADALQLIGELRYWNILREHDFTEETDEKQATQSFFQQAYEIRLKIEDKRGLAQSLYYLGVMYGFRGYEEQAEKCYREGIKIAENENFKLELSNIIDRLGFIYFEKNSLDEARHFFEHSLALRQEIDFKIYIPGSLSNIARVAEQQGDLVTAEAHLQKAIELSNAMNLLERVIFESLDLGKLYQKQGKNVEAKACFERVKVISSQIDYEYGITEATKRLEQLR